MIASSSVPVVSPAGLLAQASSRFAVAAQQLEFLYSEMSRGESGPRGFVRFLASWFRGGRVVVAAYRCKRFWLLLLGPLHFISAVWMWPTYCWCRLLGGRHEMVAQANFGRGLRVIHCSMACVVTPFAVAGKNLYLTGGNVIGSRRKGGNPGDIHLGDDVTLGIGSMVIGPIAVGDNVEIGAGAVVVKNVPAGAVIVSSPDRLLVRETTSISRQLL